MKSFPTILAIALTGFTLANAQDPGVDWGASAQVHPAESPGVGSAKPVPPAVSAVPVEAPGVAGGSGGKGGGGSTVGNVAKTDGNVYAGNGGYAIEYDGHLYSLDLYQAGNYYNPWVDPKACEKTPRGAIIMRRVRAALEKLAPVWEQKRRVAGAPVELISQKMCEIALVDWLYASMLMRGMEMYVWGFVPTMVQTYDNDKPVVAENERLIPLALRQDRHISIITTTWNDLDDDYQRAAIIYHEVGYGEIQPVPYHYIHNGLYAYSVQSSSRARQNTGYLFDKGLVSAGRARLREVTAASVPLIAPGWELFQGQVIQEYSYTNTTGAVSVFNYGLVIFPTIVGEVGEVVKYTHIYPTDIVQKPTGRELTEAGSLKVTIFCERLALFKPGTPKEIRLFYSLKQGLLGFSNYPSKRQTQEDFLQWYPDLNGSGYYPETVEIKTPDRCEGAMTKFLLEHHSLKGYE